jgi:hypothetical protein
VAVSASILSGPGIARPASLIAEHLSNLSAKLEFEQLVAGAGLDGEQQGRELARVVGYAESTVRGWRNRRALDRRPTEKACDKLRRLAQFGALNREFGALG